MSGWGYQYIHWRYDNFRRNNTTYADLTNIKQQILTNHLARAEAREKSVNKLEITDTNYEKVEDILNILLSPDFHAQREQLYSQNISRNFNQEILQASHGASYGSNKGKAWAKGQHSAAEMQRYIDHLELTIDKLYKKVTGPQGTFANFQKQVVNEYIAMNGGKRGRGLKEEILAEFIKDNKGKIGKLTNQSSTGAALNADFQQLALITYALGNIGRSYGITTQLANEVLSDINSGVQGLLPAAIGFTAEIVDKDAMQDVIDNYVLNKLIETGKYTRQQAQKMVGQIQVSVVGEDPLIAQMPSITPNQMATMNTTSTADVRIKMILDEDINGQVAFDYAYTIKQYSYSAKTGTRIGEVSLKTDTNLYNALLASPIIKANTSFRKYIYNVAGSNSLLSDGTVDIAGEGGLSAYWEEIKELAVLSATLDALAGQDTEGVIMMDLNGKTHTISSIIKEIASESSVKTKGIGDFKSNISFATFQETGDISGLSRQGLRYINRIEPGRGRVARSKAVFDHINKQLKETKISISLNNIRA